VVQGRWEKLWLSSQTTSTASFRSYSLLKSFKPPQKKTEHGHYGAISGKVSLRTIRTNDVLIPGNLEGNRRQLETDQPGDNSVCYHTVNLSFKNLARKDDIRVSFQQPKQNVQMVFGHRVHKCTANYDENVTIHFSVI